MCNVHLYHDVQHSMLQASKREGSGLATGQLADWRQVDMHQATVAFYGHAPKS